MNLRSYRIALGISQSRLARLSGVSQFKICTYELGGSTKLTVDDCLRIALALRGEAERLRNIPSTIDFDQLQLAAAETGGRP